MADNWRDCDIFGKLIRVSPNERVALYQKDSMYDVHVDCTTDGDPTFTGYTKTGGTRRFNMMAKEYAHWPKAVYSHSYIKKEAG